MIRRALLWSARRLGALLLALPLAAQVVPDAELSCKVCHPGPTRALVESPHGVLLQRAELRGKACASCHGDLSSHAAASPPAERPRAPAVAAASCNVCHPGQGRAVASATHFVTVVGSGARPLPDPAREALAELRDRQQDTSLRFSGFAELGYRFVHLAGSREAYRTDVDLDPGVRLREFEVRGRRTPAAAGPGGSQTVALDDLPDRGLSPDELDLRGRDLGDPRWDLGLQARQYDAYAIDSRYARGSYHYEATGDFHRVDRSTTTSDTTVTLIAGADWEAFGNVGLRDDEGFWLTQRIGNRNLPVQTVVDGVASPRSFRGESGELGVRSTGGAWTYTIAAGYRVDRGVDRWSYTQPATANPAFVESEDFTSRSRLEGPSARLALGRDFGDLRLDASTDYWSHTRHLEATGTAAGYDVAAFTTDTTANGDGSSRLSTSRLDGALRLGESWRLLASAGYRDHREQMRLIQTDVTITPSLNSTVTVTTDVTTQTVQRLFDGDLQLEWRPDDTFEAALGYGMAREQLRVPDLQPADPGDFRRGEQHDDGVLAHLRWQFADHLTLRAEGRDFGVDGMPLHEFTPQRSRQAVGGLEWRDDGEHAGVSMRHRHDHSDISSHRLESTSASVTAGATHGGCDWNLGYTFTTFQTATLTNFYFDPDPNPQPTVVGFDGETHTWVAALATTDLDPAHFELSVAHTRTTGSFAVQTFDLRADLRWHLGGIGDAGCEYRHMRYADEGATDDWNSDLVFVYWRATF